MAEDRLTAPKPQEEHRRLAAFAGEWTGEEMVPARLSWGVFAMMLGSALASCIGAFSNLPYPANVALLRSTRVASRRPFFFA